MNKKVKLRYQLLFWLLLNSIFGILLSFLPPLNDSLAALIVLTGFLSIYFVSGYYGKLTEKEFYLRFIENVAHKHPSPLPASLALINARYWESSEKENRKSELFIQDRVGDHVINTCAVPSGELTMLRDARFLEKCEQAGKRGAKIELFYGSSGFKELPMDEVQKIVGEIRENRAKIEDLYTQGYLQLNELKDRVQYHFSIFDGKDMYIQEKHEHGHPKKIWWIEDVPFFFRRKYRRKITALERKVKSHPSPQELIERLSKFITTEEP